MCRNKDQPDNGANDEAGGPPDKKPGELVIHDESSVDVTEMNRRHAGICENARRSIPDAIWIGRGLHLKRGTLDHGEWESWVSENLSFSSRTALVYVDLYRGQKYLKSEAVSDLTSLADAKRIISEGRRAAKEQKNLEVGNIQSRNEPTKAQKRALKKFLKKVEGYRNNLRNAINEVNAERPDAAEALIEVMSALEQGIETLEKLPEEVQDPVYQDIE